MSPAPGDSDIVTYKPKGIAVTCGGVAEAPPTGHNENYRLGIELLKGKGRVFIPDRTHILHFVESFIFLFIFLQDC